MHFSFLSAAFALSFLAAVWASADIVRPDCPQTVPVTSTNQVIQDFDDIPIVPCRPINTTTAYNGLVYTGQGGSPAAYIYNTSSTVDCHMHSGGSGPFGLSTSLFNAVGTRSGVLELQSADSSVSFNFLGLSIKTHFERFVYWRDEDPLVIGRVRGYDVCNNLVAEDTKAFYNMRRGTQPGKWDVAEPEKWKDLNKVHLKVVWWYEDNGTPLTDVTESYVDDVRYII